jgi:hypothetical protein
MKKKGEMAGIPAPLSLETAWQEVMAKYDQEPSHLAFVEKCLSTNNALFASQKYRQLIEANPGDEMAIKMRDKIIQRVTSIYLSRVPEADSNEVGFFQKALFFLFGIGFIMAALGIFFPGLMGKLISITGIVLVVLSGAILYVSRNS